MSKTNGTNKGGRPKLDIDPTRVEHLASIGCSGDEIATNVGCSRSTLYDRFSDSIEKGHNNQKVSLRRKQFELAMNGDRTMLIWLGKQYLGQADKREVAVETSGFDYASYLKSTKQNGHVNRIEERLVQEEGKGKASEDDHTTD